MLMILYRARSVESISEITTVSGTIDDNTNHIPPQTRCTGTTGSAANLEKQPRPTRAGMYSYTPLVHQLIKKIPIRNGYGIIQQFGQIRRYYESSLASLNAPVSQKKR